MTVDDLLKAFGVNKDKDLVPIINKRTSTISTWRKNGIPHAEQAVYQIMTAGKAKAKPEIKPIVEEPDLPKAA